MPATIPKDDWRKASHFIALCVEAKIMQLAHQVIQKLTNLKMKYFCIFRFKV